MTVLFFLAIACFTSSVTASPLNYWIEPDASSVWINLTTIPANDDVVINVSHGGPIFSNGTLVFDEFEDFESGYSVPVDTRMPNAPTYENIPTYIEGMQNHSVHPDVVYFADGWAGYKYWMIYTPYPDWENKTEYENPSLIASNDRHTWVVPSGITNPLAAAPPGAFGGTGYNSDPDMVYNDDVNQLWIYYDSYNNSVIKYTLIRINPDMSIEVPIELYSSPNDVNLMQRSLAIIKDGDSWHMWAENNSAPNHVQYRSSSDGIDWSSSNDVDMGMAPGMYADLWHINVEKIDDEFIMITNGPSAAGCLFLARAPISDPTHFSTYDSPILTPRYMSTTAWDAQTIYRACSLYNASTDVFSVWYSGYRTDASMNKYRIGYTEIDYSTMIGNLDTAESRGGLVSHFGQVNVSTTGGILYVAANGTNDGGMLRTLDTYNQSHMFRGRAALPGIIEAIGFADSTAMSSIQMVAIRRTSSLASFYMTISNGVSQASVESGYPVDENMHNFEIRRSATNTTARVDDTIWGSPQYNSNGYKYFMLGGGRNASLPIALDWYFVSENSEILSYDVESTDTGYTLTIHNPTDTTFENTAVHVMSDDIGITSTSDTMFINEINVDQKTVRSNLARFFNSIYNTFYRTIFQLPMRLI